MTLTELLKLIEATAQKLKISTPFICGGTPRDKVLGRASLINDLDLTTGDEGSHKLALALSQALPNSYYQRMEDGHAQITTDNLKLDFSSNFRVPGIEEFLQKSGIAHPSEMQMELYSRDFTCNALLMSLDLKTVFDPTGLGTKDIKNKLIRTCLPAKLTLGVDNKRIVRVLYLAAKLGFEVDSEISDWIKANPSVIANVKPQYLVKKLHRAFEFNEDRTAQLITEWDLWKHLPTTPWTLPYLSRPERL